MITVAEYNDPAALASLRETWRELWWKTPNASFFQSVEWLENAYQQRFGNERLRVLVVSMQERPVGIVPFVVATAWSGVGPLRVLKYADAEASFFCGPVGPSPSITLDAALKHVAETDRDWDVIDVCHVDEPAFDCGRTRRALWLGGLASHRQIDGSRAIVECHQDWVRYWGSRSETTRDDYRRCEHELAERGRIEYVRYRPEGSPLGDDNPRWDLVEEIERNSPATRRPIEKSINRPLHAAAVGIAGVDINLLRLDGRAIAWAYSYRCDGRIDVQRFGAVAEYRSPAGAVLLGRMLRDGFRRRDERYVFDTETTLLADGWQTGRAIRFRSTHFASLGPRAQVARFVSWLQKPADRSGIEYPSTSA